MRIANQNSGHDGAARALQRIYFKVAVNSEALLCISRNLCLVYVCSFVVRKTLSRIDITYTCVARAEYKYLNVYFGVDLQCFFHFSVQFSLEMLPPRSNPAVLGDV